MDTIDLACEFNSSFRLMGLTQSDVKILEGGFLLGYNYRVGSHFKDKAEKLIVIPLDEAITPSFLLGLINSLPGSHTYDFFVSTCNNNESFIIDVPKHVCELVKEVGGGITFSYTYAGDEGG